MIAFFRDWFLATLVPLYIVFTGRLDWDKGRHPGTP